MRISFFKQTVVRCRPGTKTERGSSVPDWDNTEDIWIPGCSVQPGTTELGQDGRALGVADGLTVFLPVDADVQAGDHILYNGKEYAILGEPRVWQSPTGAVSHTRLNLERWSG